MKIVRCDGGKLGVAGRGLVADLQYTKAPASVAK